jgi:hypothetical protein
MTKYALLEIGLHRHDANWYRVEPRLWLPGDDAERRPPATSSLLAQFDLERLGRNAAYDEDYGPLLTGSLFGPEELKTLFAQARALQSQDPPVPLRLRIYVGPSAPELHELRWETLRDPQHPDALLALDDNVLLSRYLSSWDWRSVRLQARTALKALAVIANPDDLAVYNLAPVDVPGELKRVRDGLGDISLEALCRCDDPGCDELGVPIVGRPTLGEMLKRLRQGYDILYLVAHGALIDHVPWVWLESDAGQTARAGPDGPDGLVTQLAQLPHLPRLVVLASCQSAGQATADGGALSALGPRLAEAGVPAVVAMQGNVAMPTVEDFIPAFFEELRQGDGAQQGGQIDSAMAVARRAVKNAGRSDWWVPALFMRLHSGRLWYRPRFATEDQDEIWEELLGNVRFENCTPILGPGLIDFLAGPRQEIARCWAESRGFPMAPHNLHSLPQVARYLATIKSPGFPRLQLLQHVRDEIWRRHGDQLEGEAKNARVEHLVRVLGARCRQASETDPHRVLAQLPVKIYLTANPDDLLFDALDAAGKDPQVAVCPWHEDVRQPNSAFRADPDYEPSVEQPLVYHLFGRLDRPASLVITEDDYFRYLIQISKEQERSHTGSQIPLLVSQAWSESALLFLGFQIDDWVFRILLHSLAGYGSYGRPKSVAVQVNPEQGQFLQPDRAAGYLKVYLDKFQNLNTNVFWGSAQDFVTELWVRRDDWR